MARYENFLLVVEEVAAVCQTSYLPPAFGRIVRHGRHRRIGMLWTTQRLNEVSRTLTSLTDVWAGFSLSEPADLTALAQRCGREYAEKVSELPRFEWRGWDVDTQAIPRRRAAEGLVGRAQGVEVPRSAGKRRYRAFLGNGNGGNGNIETAAGTEHIASLCPW